MDDEHALTLAVLHSGHTFYCAPSGVWFEVSSENVASGLEKEHLDRVGHFYWLSKEELAQDYCKFYKLGAYSV